MLDFHVEMSRKYLDMSLGEVWTRDDQAGRWQRGVDEVVRET